MAAVAASPINDLKIKAGNGADSSQGDDVVFYVLNEAQRSVASHQRLCVRLAQLANEEFESIAQFSEALFLHIIPLFFNHARTGRGRTDLWKADQDLTRSKKVDHPNKPGPDRLLDFLSTFLRQPCYLRDDEVTLTLLEQVLPGVQAADNTVRLRCCQLVTVCVGALKGVESEDEGKFDDLRDRIIDAVALAMQPRLHDRMPAIRAEAVSALRRLQDPKAEGDDVFVSMLYASSVETAVEVRRRFVQCLQFSGAGQAHLFTFIRDVDASIRKLAWVRLANIKPHRLRFPKSGVPFSGMISLLAVGLTDAEPSVRATASECLIAWISSLPDKDPLRFLSLCRVASANVDECDTVVQEIVLWFLMHRQRSGDKGQKAGSFELVSSDLSAEKVVMFRALLAMAAYDHGAENFVQELGVDAVQIAQWSFSLLQAAISSADVDPNVCAIPASDSPFFIGRQLLRCAQYMDYSDGVSRDTMLKTIKSVLGNYLVATPELLVPECIAVLGAIGFDSSGRIFRFQRTDLTPEGVVIDSLCSILTPEFYVKDIPNVGVVVTTTARSESDWSSKDLDEIVGGFLEHFRINASLDDSVERAVALAAWHRSNEVLFALAALLEASHVVLDARVLSILEATLSIAPALKLEECPTLMISIISAATRISVHSTSFASTIVEPICVLVTDPSTHFDVRVAGLRSLFDMALFTSPVLFSPSTFHDVIVHVLSQFLTPMPITDKAAHKVAKAVRSLPVRKDCKVRDLGVDSAAHQLTQRFHTLHSVVVCDPTGLLCRIALEGFGRLFLSGRLSELDSTCSACPASICCEAQFSIADRLLASVLFQFVSALPSDSEVVSSKSSAAAMWAQDFLPRFAAASPRRQASLVAAAQIVVRHTVSNAFTVCIGGSVGDDCRAVAAPQDFELTCGLLDHVLKTITTLVDPTYLAAYTEQKKIAASKDLSRSAAKAAEYTASAILVQHSNLEAFSLWILQEAIAIGTGHEAAQQILGVLTRCKLHRFLALVSVFDQISEDGFSPNQIRALENEHMVECLSIVVKFCIYLHAILRASSGIAIPASHRLRLPLRQLLNKLVVPVYRLLEVFLKHEDRSISFDDYCLEKVEDASATLVAHCEGRFGSLARDNLCPESCADVPEPRLQFPPLPPASAIGSKRPSTALEQDAEELELRESLTSSSASRDAVEARRISENAQRGRGRGARGGRGGPPRRRVQRQPSATPASASASETSDSSDSSLFSDSESVSSASSSESDSE